MGYGRRSFRCTSNFEHKNSTINSSRLLKHTTQSTVNVHRELLTRTAILGSSSFQLFPSSVALEKSQHVPYLTNWTTISSQSKEPWRKSLKISKLVILISYWPYDWFNKANFFPLPFSSVLHDLPYTPISLTPSLKTFLFNLHQITVLICILPAPYPECLNAIH